MRFWISLALLVAAFTVGVLVCHTATASTSRERILLYEKREARQVRAIEGSKHTLRWFERHPWLLQPSLPGQPVVTAATRRRAWRVVRFNRARIAWTRRELRETRAALDQLRRPAALGPVSAIRVVFGSYADEGIRVADCETGRTWSLASTNGQYLGMFQMGEQERATYGHGTTALDQARAAYRYFVATGKDWSPWECKPWWRTLSESLRDAAAAGAL